LKQGIQIQYKYKGRTDEKQGISFKKDTICFKGSEVDRKFSLTGLEKVLEFQRTQTLKLEQTQKQKLGLMQSPSRDKILSRQDSRTILSQGKKKDLSHDRGKGLEKTINILLKPEKNNDQIPRELLQEAEPRRRFRISR
jgi:hypothetical protein